MVCSFGFWQVDFSEKPVFWKALKPPLKDKCGELLVSLCYHPTNSTLTLIALKARNLKAKDINGKSGVCLFGFLSEPISMMSSFF